MTDNPLAAGERVRAIPPPTAMVVFGGSGDLAHRKIVPALYNLELHRLLPQNFAFVGSSRSEYSDEEYRADMRKAVEEFSRTEYALALHEGDRLPAERRKEIAAKVARYSGLSQEYVERTNLRIDIYRFVKELLRDQGKTVGRLDTRFTGRDLDAAGESFEYDPASVSVGGPYVAAINDYIRRELEFDSDLVYEFLSRRVQPWSFEDSENQYLNMAEYLRQAMVRNPDLKVLITAGYYDLATPYFDSVYTVDHLGLPPELRGNIRIANYEAGHMMYIRAADHRKLKQDIVGFLREAMR